MKELQQVFIENKIIYEHLFEVRFLTTKCNQQSLIVLCYKQPLHKKWLEEAEKLGQQLNAKIIGRARKMKVVTGGNQDDEYIEERLEICGKEYIYYQTEGAFSQPNAFVCEKMITWAMKMTENSHDHDLLELYCGGGTFTAPLSTNFRQVLATEISKASVEIAGRCFKANHINNIKVAKLSSEEFTEFYTGKRVFQRLQLSGINKHAFNIGTVFVDPPRSGLDEGTCKLISRFNKIVYVSCNPETLARDVKMLSETHTMTNVAAFDQFPYTHHLESGVVMVRKADAPIPTEPIETGVISNDTEESEESVAKKARVESEDQSM
jgi:tRNA (uracil-5-)-methyltransferase